MEQISVNKAYSAMKKHLNATEQGADLCKQFILACTDYVTGVATLRKEAHIPQTLYDQMDVAYRTALEHLAKEGHELDLPSDREFLEVLAAATVKDPMGI